MYTSKIGQLYTGRITKIEQKPAGIMLVWLNLIENFDNLHNPGQYLQIQLEQDWSFFSIASLPYIDAPLELHIQTQDQNRVQYLVDIFSEQRLIQVRYAFGIVKWPLHLSRGYFVCRGTGFAPAKALIEAGLLRNPDRAVHFVWEADRSSEFYFDGWLQLMLEKHQNFQVTLTCPDPLLISKTHERLETKTTSLIDILRKQSEYLNDTWFYCCASPVRVYEWTDILCSKNIPLTHIASDVFEYAPRSA